MKILIFVLVVTILVAKIIKKHKKEFVMNAPQKAEARDVSKVTHNTIHDVFVANTHLIPDKLLSILVHILGTEDDHGVHSIVFTENLPQAANGDMLLSKFYPESRAIVINLEGHLVLAKVKMKQADCRLNFWFYLWQQLIRTKYHEIHHAERFADADNIYSVDTDTYSFEKDAEAYALDRIIDLAKEIDIEAPAPEDFPYFADKIPALSKELLEDEKPEAWTEIQQWTLLNNVVYFDPGLDGKVDPEEIKTAREYFKRIAEDDDSRWDAPVASMSEMVKAKPAPEPESENATAVRMGMHDQVEENIIADKVRDLTAETKVAVDEGGTVLAAIKPEPEPESDGPKANATLDQLLGKTTAEEPATTTVSKPDPVYADEGCPFDPFDGVEVEEFPIEPLSPTHTAEGIALPTEKEFVQTLTKHPDLPVPAAPTMAGGNVSIDLGLNPGTGVTEMPKPAMKQLEPTGLSGPEQMAVLQQVLFRLYAHIFQKCGWDWKGGFTNLEGIHQPVYIGDIPGANKLFHSYEVVENKTSVEKRVEDHIVGHIMPKAGIPGYHLYLNVNGMKGKRAFLPQNPNKTKANSQELTAWAKRARAGEMIGMLSQEGKGVRVSIITPVGGQTEYKNDPFKN